MNNQINEKRKYPRFKKRIPLHLTNERSDLIAYTRDISRRGALCELNYQIPLMSKLEIRLQLPPSANGKAPLKEIKCLGVVVRSQPVVKNTEAFYDTAIFFTKVNKNDEHKIAQYIEGNTLNQNQETIF